MNKNDNVNNGFDRSQSKFNCCCVCSRDTQTLYFVQCDLRIRTAAKRKTIKRAMYLAHTFTSTVYEHVRLKSNIDLYVCELSNIYTKFACARIQCMV